MKTRIELTDTLFSAMEKMCEGNPGAMVSLTEMCVNNKTIDPQDAFGELGPVLSLDTLGIYGPDIYVLHNDICENKTAKTLSILRANQLGLLSSDIIKDACSRQDRSGKELIDIDKVYEDVRNRLSGFDR